MLRSYRLLIAAVVGLAVQPIGEGSYAQDRASNGEAKPQEAPGVIAPFDLAPLNERLESIDESIEALKAGPESADENRRAEGDLKAQEDMAKWAFWMLVATSASVAVSAAGVGLIVFTLRQNKRSMRIALSGVRRASQSVRVAQQTARRELRAYVFGHPKNVHVSGKTLVSVTLTVRNHGSTPASNVGMKGGVNIYPYPLPNEVIIDFPEVDMTTQTLPPGAEFPAKIAVNRTATAIDEQRLRAGTHRLYAFAVIKYRDAFGHERTTKTCSAMDGPTFMELVDLSVQGIQGTANHDDAWQFSSRYNDWT
jgi:hypothetical protein